jgi:translation initiation factor IF-3
MNVALGTKSEEKPAVPPVAKLQDYGKFQYAENKKLKASKSGAKSVELKTIQVKVGTGAGDLQLKAKKASEWISEGHRIRIDLFLPGRTKYMDEKFLRERSTTEIHRQEDSKGVPKLKQDANRGGKISGNARKALEKELKRSVVSKRNFLPKNTIKLNVKRK